MKRREFITLLGGAAAAWPFAAQAQERVRRVGVLMTTSLGDPETQARTKAFLQGLQELGWTEGLNIRFDIRWDTGTVEGARKVAAELVAALSPEVILASGVTSLVAVQTNCDIPIVFAIAPDPVGAGFVESLAQPGGNVTGFMQFEYSLSGKWLELLKEIAPGVTRAAVLRDPAVSAGVRTIRRYPGSSAGNRHRRATDRRTRGRRNRARRYCLCARSKWRLGCDSQSVDNLPSRIDRPTC